jgi:very-short-patch-repair endonuclease
MATTDAQRTSRALWRLARRQHGVLSRAQLLEHGLTVGAIKHRLQTRRLHPVMRAVYAVGRPELSPEGRLMAAVLTCPGGAVISHGTAAAAWGLTPSAPGRIEVSVPRRSSARAPGIRIHRRESLPRADLTRRHNIPTTSPALTLVDLATRLPPAALEAAVNEADRLDLIDPVRLRERLEAMPRVPGIGLLRACIDRHTLVLTDSELERRFLRLIRGAGLPEPLTQQQLNGHRVDFHWPDLGLVVETDGLRYHRTPGQQNRDRRRDQALARAGLTCLRFTHAQVRHEPDEVADTLRRVAARLSSSR